MEFTLLMHVVLISSLFEQTAKQWSKLALFFSDLSLTLQSMVGMGYRKTEGGGGVNQYVGVVYWWEL